MSDAEFVAGLVADLDALLAQHTPVDDREERSLITTRRGLAELRQPFDEHAGPTHVTASAIVAGQRGTVLHLHRRLGIWLQPGGHIEPGEDPARAAVREAQEETGLAVHHPTGGPVLVHVDVHAGPRGHTHLDVRYLLVVDDELRDPSPPPGESPDARWFEWEEAASIADQGLLGGLRSARRALEQLLPWLPGSAGPRHGG